MASLLPLPTAHHVNGLRQEWATTITRRNLAVREEAGLAQCMRDERTWLGAVPRSENGPIAEVVGFNGERPKPSYRSVTPLDARRLPTFN
jgi:hypothetical protein